MSKPTAHLSPSARCLAPPSPSRPLQRRLSRTAVTATLPLPPTTSAPHDLCPPRPLPATTSRFRELTKARALSTRDRSLVWQDEAWLDSERKDVLAGWCCLGGLAERMGHVWSRLPDVPLEVGLREAVNQKACTHMCTRRPWSLPPSAPSPWPHLPHPLIKLPCRSRLRRRTIARWRWRRRRVRMGCARGELARAVARVHAHAHERQGSDTHRSPHVLLFAEAR